MNVELHIGEVVLVGATLPPGGEAELRRTMQRELTALIYADPLSTQLAEPAHVAQMTSTDVSLGPGPISPRDLGRDVARSLHRRLAG